jgi:hypothetical protein
MMNRKYLIILTAGLIFFGSYNYVLAEDTAAPFNLNDINQLIKQASNSAARKQDQLQNIIKAADAMIANRIATLNALNTKIQGNASLTTDIQNAITGLNTLKTIIDADTDLAKAKADAKQIVTNFRIYEILEPKMRLLVTINNLQTTSTNVSKLIPQIQNLINTEGSAGKDVTELNTLLADITSQLTTINNTLASDLATVQGITVTSTNSKDVFSKVRQDMAQIVRADFAKIRSDFGKMRETFHQLFTGSIKNATISGETKSPKPSATPISTP